MELDHQVGRLNVAMDQAMLVGVVQSEADLPHQFTSQADGQRAALRNPSAQIDAVDELHHQEMSAVGLGRIVGRDDIRMAKLAGNLDFAPEIGPRLPAQPESVGRST